MNFKIQSSSQTESENKTLIINFSLRQNSGSLKISNYIKSKLTQSSVLSYIDMNLPMWDEGVWKNEEKWIKLLAPIKKEISLSDAFVFVVPEYSGSASPAFFNFMLFLGSFEEASHKPALIVTNSSSRGGTYPQSQIRGYTSKNSRIVYIPEHIIVRNNADVLNTELNTVNSDDQFIRDRIDYSLMVLAEYSKRLKGLSSMIQPDPRFKNGM